MSRDQVYLDLISVHSAVHRLCRCLLYTSHSVTLIDTNEELLEKISSQMDVMVVHGNAKEIKILKQLDIDSYDYLIATTFNDEANIIIASFAKKLGCNKVVARVRDPEHMQQINFIKETMDIEMCIRDRYPPGLSNHLPHLAGRNRNKAVSHTVGGEIFLLHRIHPDVHVYPVGKGS